MVTTILVVEDDPVLRTMLTLFLATDDVVVVAVDTLPGALAVLQARPVDLVISDVQLGEGSGLEVARAARARFGATVTIVLISGGELAQQGAEAAGADAFVGKPFFAPDLIERCATLMARAGRSLARSELCLRTKPVA